MATRLKAHELKNTINYHSIVCPKCKKAVISISIERGRAEIHNKEESAFCRNCNEEIIIEP